MKRQRGIEKTDLREPRAISLTLSLYPLLFISLCLASCARPISEAEKRAAVDEFFTRARSCWPTNDRKGEGEDNLKLAVESVVNTENSTHVRLIAYALDEAVDFHLPVYLLSAGRWLINEKERAYLLDERCREIKLKDRKPTSDSLSGERRIPRDGLIRLSPGQAFEATLIFPPLPDQTRVGALVYEGCIMPFILNTDTRQP